MLIDSIVVHPSLGPALAEVASRKLKYLDARAGAVRRRRPVDRERLNEWHTPVVLATLRIEAAETATLIGKWTVARSNLRDATKHLLDAGLPAGAAIAMAFQGSSKGRSMEELMRDWADRPDERDDDGAHARDLRIASLAQPQQRAYLAIARFAAGEDFGMDSGGNGGMRALEAAAFGRHQIPMEMVATILQAKMPPRPAQKAAPKALGREHEMMARLLSDLHRTIVASRRNEYLWNQLMAPTPLFDLDIALLLAALSRKTKSRPTAMGVALEQRLDEKEKPFAIAFCHAVEQLMGSGR